MVRFDGWDRWLYLPNIICDERLITMTIMKIKPISVRRIRYRKLDKKYQDAAYECTDTVNFHQIGCDDNRIVRIETFATADIRHLFENVFQWPCTVAALTYYPDDVRRVKRIMRKIPKEGQWPYVSYWARTFKELQEIEIQPSGEISVSNHGDGWHRVIAAVELELPTVEIMFFQ